MKHYHVTFTLRMEQLTIKMWFQDFQKYHIVICFIICIYLSKLNADASVVKGCAKSYEDGYEKTEDINLDQTNAEKKFKCPSLFGNFPDVEDCSKFYLCVAGISKRLPCSSFKHFDKYRRKCVSIIIAICDKGKEGKTTTVQDKKITKEGRTTVPDKDITKEPLFLCKSMFGSFPHPTDCSKYYGCSFFIPSLKTCPDKKLFDGIKKECRPESEVNCGSREKPTSETTLATTPLLPKSTTPEPTTAEKTSHNPTTPEITTPEPTTQELTTPEPTTPEESTVTEEETTVIEQTAPETDCDEDDLDCIITETGEIPVWFKCPVELGSHRHPSSKKLFIFCINWKPYVKKCGQDLVFSKELRTCVPP